MADRPILFSAPMVQALLAGRKTQTRRVISCTSKEVAPGQILIFEGPRFGGTAYRFDPRFEVGDRLYVREEWRIGKKWDEVKPSLLPLRAMTVLYGAGGESTNRVDGTWGLVDDAPEGLPDWAGRRRAGMHMPRWASRLTLTVTGVKVERLQSCSEAEAWAEGICKRKDTGTSFIDVGDRILAADTAAYCYQMLWDHINGEGAWAANPWVVAVSFDVRKGNIDG